MDDKIEFDINRNRAEEMASVVTMLLQERGELSLVKVQDCVITTVEHRLPQYIAEEREACCKAVCFQCARGDHPVEKNNFGAWVHVGREWIETCKAQAIRGRTDSLAPAPASAAEKAD